MFSALAIWLFFWAVDNNQYDDLDASAQSILFDDDDIDKNKHQQPTITGKTND
jgi:cbb3-type cytochrome oxidase maturation protein